MLIKKAGEITPVSAQCVMIIEQHITLISIMRLLTVIPRIKVPFAAVWGRDGVMAKTFDMDSVWKTKGKLYSSIEMPGGHFLLISIPWRLLK